MLWAQFEISFKFTMDMLGRYIIAGFNDQWQWENLYSTQLKDITSYKNNNSTSFCFPKAYLLPRIKKVFLVNFIT